jgi:hypothetical protein
MIYRLNMARPQLQKGVKAKCSTAAFPKLFTFREVESRFLFLQCHAPSLRTAALPPCSPLDIRDPLREDRGFFDGG